LQSKNASNGRYIDASLFLLTLKEDMNDNQEKKRLEADYSFVTQKGLEVTTWCWMRAW